MVEFESGTIGKEFSMELPIGYTEKHFSGDNEYQQEYWYQDSTVFYITTFRNTLNYKAIREQGTYYDRFEALNSGDSITLSGIDDNGKYWKDKLIQGGVTIGYSNASHEKKLQFEEAIFSLKMND